MQPSTTLSLRTNTVALRHAIASAAMALLSVYSLGANAQNAVSTSAPADQAQAASQPATGGRTRAEVVAELMCARSSGEMDAALLRSYGLDMGTTPSQPSPCTQAIASDASKPLAQ